MAINNLSYVQHGYRKALDLSSPLPSFINTSPSFLWSPRLHSRFTWTCRLLSSMSFCRGVSKADGRGRLGRKLHWLREKRQKNARRKALRHDELVAFHQQYCCCCCCRGLRRPQTRLLRTAAYRPHFSPPYLFSSGGCETTATQLHKHHTASVDASITSRNTPLFID